MPQQTYGHVVGATLQHDGRARVAQTLTRWHLNDEDLGVGVSGSYIPVVAAQMKGVSSLDQAGWYN